MAEVNAAEGKVKKKRGRKALKVLLCIVIIILLFIAVTTAVNAIGNKANMNKAKSFEKIQIENQLVPEKDELGNYTFTADRDLKIVQLTDIHIGGGWMCFKKDAMALNTVAAMLTAEKPDLVIVTGDIAYPVPFQAGTFNNKVPAKIFAGLMDTLGVYWTLGFGNHDTEAYSVYTREDISALYSSGDYKYLIYQAGPEEVSGCGNQVINVRNSEGIITQSLYILDSHSYTDGDILGVMWKYDNLHQDQIDWYADTLAKYDEINARAAEKNGSEPQKINSLMFFHIPLTEYKDAWYEYIENGFKDTENVKFVFGDAGEPKKVVYCGIGDDEMFETIQKLGSTKAVFCGHDHKNNFSVMYKGIQLTYGMSVDYLAYPGIYKLGAQRGCTIINVKPDGTYDCRPENYYQDKYRSMYEKEPVTMQTVEPVSEIVTD